MLEIKKLNNAARDLVGRQRLELSTTGVEKYAGRSTSQLSDAVNPSRTVFL